MLLRSSCIAWFLLAGVGCKKDTREGLPPAQEWTNPAVGSAAPMPPGPANPHAGAMPANPHGGTMPANPHEGQPPPMATKVEPKTLAKRPDGKLTLGPFALTLPKGWTEKPVTSNMRAAHFALPAAKPGEDAELVVFYFGSSGAGSDEDNISRWLEQIVQPDGKATKDVAKMEKIKVNGQDTTLISVTGKYVPMAMSGTPTPEVPDGMMLASIVKSPSGPYYFKLTGAKSTVSANAAAFRSMLTSLAVQP